MTTDPAPRYSFQPLEKRGLLLGLDAIQLLTVAGGAVSALVVHAAAGGTPGALAAFALLVTSAVGALWSRSGRPLVHWGPVAAGWAARRSRGAVLSDTPLEGAVRPRFTLPPGIELIGDPADPGQPELGVVHDRIAHRWVAALPVRGRSFSLLDPGEQAQMLEAWRSVLGAVARPGSPVTRLQWIVRTNPAGDCPVPGDPGHPPSAESYRELIGAAVPEMVVQESWLIVGVGRGSVQALRRELRLLEGQLRSADLVPAPPASPDQLRQLIASPLAVREEWSALHADDSVHVTYWVAEWPRVEVSPDFLVPLLTGSSRRTVSLVMAPVAPDRSLREARSARTADVADAELRARAGFLPSARREKEAHGVARREAELADGHTEYRFSGYVTVSAGDRAGLAAACAEVEHSAQTGRLELRRLYGRQREAFTWTQPFARGLR